jgi:hypothetical protein
MSATTMMLPRQSAAAGQGSSSFLGASCAPVGQEIAGLG